MISSLEIPHPVAVAAFLAPAPHGGSAGVALEMAMRDSAPFGEIGVARLLGAGLAMLAVAPPALFSDSMSDRGAMPYFARMQEDPTRARMGMMGLDLSQPEAARSAPMLLPGGARAGN